LCVFALLYLIRQSMNKKESEKVQIGMADPNLQSDDSTRALNGIGGTVADNTGAAGTSAAPGGALVTTTPAVPTSASTATRATPASGGGGSTTSTKVSSAPAGDHSKGGSIASKGTGTATTATASKGNFWVVAGSFSDEEKAKAQVQTLKSKGFSGATIVKDATTGNSRVIAAKFADNSGAEAEVRNLGKHHIPAFISKQ
jgi:cell division septation protein DedD